VFQEHRGFYGSPRIHQELRATGRPIEHHRVARLMQRAGLRAKTRRAFRPCSKASGTTGVAENLLEQDFTPPEPNRCWAGDITYIRTTSGWRYLAAWMDCSVAVSLAGAWAPPWRRRWCWRLSTGPWANDRWNRSSC
jgi:transposase InsO family protein